MTEFHLKVPAPQEAEILSRLVLRSKAHWGYSDAFMADCVEVLRIHPSDLEAPGYLVAYEAATDTPWGISLLEFEDGDAVLDKLFVDPVAMGKGVGAALFRQAVAAATEAGAPRMTVVSDPQAEPFYLKMGAQRIGEMPSEAIPGRVLPYLSYTL